ncbi:MAG: hypothetical protein HY606_07460 [Planctomycetes bacterium]|nr:hypothetical protein [Planctomycetota bacterium]
MLLISLPLYPEKQNRKNISEDPMMQQIDRLQKEIYILSIFDRLNLTKNQLDRLCSIAEEAQQLTIDFKNDILPILKEQKTAYEKFKEEDIRNTGFTTETEKATAVSNHLGKMREKNFFDKINVLEEKTQDLLTDEQLEIINSLRDCRKTLKDLPAILRERNKILMQRQNINNKEEEHGSINTGLEDGSCKSDDDSASSPAERLRQYHQEKYGSIGPIGRLLVQEEIVTIISRKIGKTVKTAAKESADELHRYKKEVDELHTDISLLNLLNGLNLSRDQIQRLITTAKEAEEISSDTNPINAFDREDMQIAIPTLAGIIPSLRQSMLLTTEQLYEIERLERDIKNKVHRKSLKYNKKQLNQLELEIEAALSANQKQAIIDFSPCLIPPKNLKDPVRVGQASDKSHYTHLLEKIRSVNPKKYEKDKKAILSEIISRAENHGGKFTDKEKADNLAKLEEIIDKTRNMTDSDFELSKNELADKLKFLDLKETLKEELEKQFGDKNILAHKIKSNLLNPRVIPLLETRYKQLKDNKSTQQTDLNKIDPAENCNDGKCAIED